MKTTICLKCKNCINQSKNQIDPIWYQLYCKATPFPDTVDYTTGIREGGYKHCRDINTDGKCPKYQEK
jgi:hypothetical protein